MKKIVYINVSMFFLFGVIMLLAFGACERQADKVNETGKVGFSLMTKDVQEVLKSAEMKDTGIVEPYSILISLLNKDSVLVMEKKQIPVYKFSNSFVSEMIDLNVGSYLLSEFMVLDPSGEVIYAAPRYGSEFAQLVSRPLPFYFNVEPNTQSRLSIEVIAVEDNLPEKFGYVSFGVQIINPLLFYAAVYIDNPMLMAPSTLIAAKVQIVGPDGWTYEFDMDPKVNKLILRYGEGNYLFVVKAANYSGEYSYSLEQIKNADQDNPLMIPVNNENAWRQMIIRTSPDACFDALITNLNPDENYGNTKEFKAAFISEPLLTVMRTTRSLMHFDFGRQLPKSASIKKVEMTVSAFGGAFITGDTAGFQGVLKLIVEAWDEDSVTWSNQPATSNANQVFIDYQPWMSTIRRTYDITKLYVPQQEIAYRQYGFMFMQYPESIPGGMSFASSDAEQVEMRPEFKVYYTLP